VGADGAFAYERIAPGPRSVELRHSPQYRSKAIARVFAAGATMTLGGDLTHMDRAPSAITVNVSPPNARVRWQCGQGVVQVREGSFTSDCAEEQVVVTAEAPGYETVSRPWTVAPGETQSFSIVLPKMMETGRIPACDPADFGRSGWKREGEWWSAPQGMKMSCPGLAGVYTFTLQSPRKSIEWSWSGGARNLTVQLDKKSVAMAGGTKKEIADFEESGSLKFKVVVEASMVTAYVLGNTWVKLGQVQGDTRGGHFEFAKNIRLKDFSRSER